MNKLTEERLLSLGLEVSDEDIERIEYIEELTDEYLRNVYGIDENSDVAYARADLVCSRFLSEKRADLTAEEERYIIKSVSEGDASVSYGESTVESVIERLADESVFKGYRKIKW